MTRKKAKKRHRCKFAFFKFYLSCLSIKLKLLIFREKRAREAQSQIDGSSTSLMLVVIVSIFLIVNLPQAIFIGLLCVCTTFGVSMKLFEGIFPAAFLLANNMLVMVRFFYRLISNIL